MNEEILKNIWTTLFNDNMTTSDFDTWKNNFVNDPEVLSNVYNYLRENNLTNSSPDEWVENISTPSLGAGTLEQPEIPSIEADEVPDLDDGSSKQPKTWGELGKRLLFGDPDKQSLTPGFGDISNSARGVVDFFKEIARPSEEKVTTEIEGTDRLKG